LNPALIRNMTYPTPLSRWRLRERNLKSKQDPQAPKPTARSTTDEIHP
jgi:hypothetical protein